MNKRQRESLYYMAKLRAFLVEKPRTAEELVAHMGTTLNCVTKYCRRMQWPEGRVFISDWYFCKETDRWKCLRSFGQQDDAPHPPKMTHTESGKRFREKLKSDPVRMARLREVQRQKDAERKARRNAMARARRAQEAKEKSEREILYGRRDFSHIQPHIDPWAMILHGGAAMLAGVAA